MLTSDQLISAVRIAAQLATSETDFTDAVVLDYANRVIADSFTTDFALERQGFGQVYEDYVLSTNVESLRVSPRAMGGDIERVAACTYGQDNSYLQDLTLLTLEQSISDISPAGFSYTTPPAFYLQSGEIRFVPKPVNQNRVRVWFYLRHPTLVLDASATSNARINSVTSFNSDDSVTVSITALHLSGTNHIVDIVDSASQVVLHDVNMAVDGSTAILTTPVPRRVPEIMKSFTGLDTGFTPAATMLGLDNVQTFARGTSSRLVVQDELQQAVIDWAAAAILNDRGDYSQAKATSELANAKMKKIKDAQVQRVKGKSVTVLRRNSYLRRRANLWRSR